MLKQVLDERDFSSFIGEVSYELSLLDGRVEVIPQRKILDRMGFPENWEDITNI